MHGVLWQFLLRSAWGRRYRLGTKNLDPLSRLLYVFPNVTASSAAGNAGNREESVHLIEKTNAGASEVKLLRRSEERISAESLGRVPKVRGT